MMYQYKVFMLTMNIEAIQTSPFIHLDIYQLKYCLGQ